MAEAVEVLGDGGTSADVVAADDVRAGDDLVRRDRHDREVRVDAGANERPLAPLRLRENQAVYPALPDPAEDDGRVVSAAQLEAPQHQPRRARGKLLLDAGEQLDEPGIVAPVDDYAYGPPAAETEVARGLGTRVAQRRDHLR